MIQEFFYFIPEAILVFVLVVLVILELAEIKHRSFFGLGLGLFGLFFSMLAIFWLGAEVKKIATIHSLFFRDGLSVFFKLFFLASAFFSFILVSHSQEVSKARRIEFYILILGGTLASCFLVCSAHFILLFVSLLLFQLVASLLAAFNPETHFSIEAGVKNFSLGTVSFLLFFYVVGVLFFYSHSFHLVEIHQFFLQKGLPDKVTPILFLFGFLLLSFYMGVFPLYFGVPDLIQGAPTPISSYLALVQRGIGVLLATRFVFIFFSSPPSLGEPLRFDWSGVLSLCSALSLLIGSLLAYQQTSMKRLIGYLVVSQSGFSLMGLLVLSSEGLVALLYHLMTELFALVGIFYFLFFAVDQFQSDCFRSLNGLLKKMPFEGICLILFCLCLIGFPPLPGFLGKFMLMGAVYQDQNPFLICVAVISLVVSLATVARLFFYLMGQEGEEMVQNLPLSFKRRFFFGGLAIPLVLCSLFSDLILQWLSRVLEGVL